MDIDEYFKLSYKRSVFGEYSLPRPPIVCRDGFTVSVQGSEFHYCTPRKSGLYFESYELGFPEPFDDWLLEALNEDNPEDVFGYVPKDIVSTLLERHGGIDEDKMLSILTMVELVDENS